MKALTVRQPWATLISQGTKVYETRSWPPPKTLIGERIAIHAGKQCDHRAADGFGYAPYDMPLGVVVCTARIVAAHVMHDRWPVGGGMTIVQGLGIESQNDPDRWTDATLQPTHARIPSDQRDYGDYAPGRWAWRLVDVEPLDPPVPARGRQGLWNWVHE